MKNLLIKTAWAWGILLCMMFSCSDTLEERIIEENNFQEKLEQQVEVDEGKSLKKKGKGKAKKDDDDSDDDDSDDDDSDDDDSDDDDSDEKENNGKSEENMGKGKDKDSNDDDSDDDSVEKENNGKSEENKGKGKDKDSEDDDNSDNNDSEEKENKGKSEDNKGRGKDRDSQDDMNDDNTDGETEDERGNNGKSGENKGKGKDKDSREDDSSDDGDSQADKEMQADFRTQTIGGWGSKPKGNNPGFYLHQYFEAAFPNGITIGSGEITVQFTSAQAITDYLPAGGKAQSLVESIVDPTAQELKNNFVSQLLAATITTGLDLAISDFSKSDMAFSRLEIAEGELSGLIVSQILEEANKAMVGEESDFTITQLLDALANINESFVDGKTSTKYLK